MPKFNPRDTDWNRIERIQNTPPSGKDKNSRGGNFRVSAGEYNDGIDRIKGNGCTNKSCKYWADRRMILFCTLYNGDKDKIKDCPEKENTDA